MRTLTLPTLASVLVLAAACGQGGDTAARDDTTTGYPPAASSTDTAAGDQSPSDSGDMTASTEFDPTAEPVLEPDEAMPDETDMADGMPLDTTGEADRSDQTVLASYQTEYVGSYAADEAACDADAVVLAESTVTTPDDGECEINDLQADGSGVRVTANCMGEGDANETVWTLERTAEGIDVAREDGTTVTLVQCGNAMDAPTAP